MGETTWSDLPLKRTFCRKTSAHGGSCNVGDQEAEIKLSKQLVTPYGAMLSAAKQKEICVAEGLQRRRFLDGL